ncbi:MAG TPA: hypothetical protein VGD64_03500 [Acidisarcina sp.]
MTTTIELPESVYLRSEQIARSRGLSVDELIVRALERELAAELPPNRATERVVSPIIRSKHPGTLDLTNFDFDDLLS